MRRRKPDNNRIEQLKSSLLVFLSLVIVVQSAVIIGLLKRVSKKPAVDTTEQDTSRAVTTSRELKVTRTKESDHREKKSLAVSHVEPIYRKISVPASEDKEAVVAPVKSVPALPAAPAVKKSGKGKIALVLDDFGNGLRHEDFVRDDRFRITLSILPFKTHSENVARLAHEHGKQVIIHVPMEPHNSDDYGLEPNTLNVGMTKSVVWKMLDGAFASVPHAAGISNHMGSRATEDERLMAGVMEYLKRQKKFFLDSLVTSQSVVSGVAKKYGVRTASRDIFIDNESDKEYIRAQLRKLASRAQKNGMAIGIGHDRPHTIAVLMEMIPLLEQEGFEFVHVSDVVK